MRAKKLSWREVHALSKTLARKVRRSAFAPNCLIGITVGGLVPLALVADALKTKDVVTISARSYQKKRQGKLHVTALPKIDLRGKRVLLVDEIADRGTTLKYLAALIKNKYKAKEVRTATLVVNTKNCTFMPDFFVLETRIWIVFPWDT